VAADAQLGAVTRPAVAGIVLAAGASRRLGRPKPLLVLAGQTLLARAVAAQLEAGLDPVVVVLGHAADEVRASAGLPADARLRIVVNPDWGEGMASSLLSGLEACDDADAVVLALADQPDTDAARVRAVVEAWDGEAPLVVPEADGRPSHPVLFAKAVYGELRALRGDVGGRAVVERHRASAIRVPLPALRDVDTEDDYRAAVDRAEGPDGGKKLT
jgi:molybdenum cofactor cytidylyltransferase